MISSISPKNMSVRHALIGTGEYKDFPLIADRVALIITNHPYNGKGGAYLVTGGYNSSGSVITTLLASEYIESITKPTITSVRVKCSTGTFVTVLGGGKHTFAPERSLRWAA